MKSYAFISSILAGAKMRDCNQFDTIRYIFFASPFTFSRFEKT